MEARPHFFSLANGFRAGPTLDALSRPLLTRIFETCWDRSFPEHVCAPFWRACQRLAWIFHAHSDCHQRFHEALVICVHGHPLAITTWCRAIRTQFIPPPQVEIQLAFTHALSHWSAVQILRDGFVRPCAVRESHDVDWSPILSFTHVGLSIKDDTLNQASLKAFRKCNAYSHRQWRLSGGRFWKSHRTPREPHYQSSRWSCVRTCYGYFL